MEKLMWKALGLTVRGAARVRGVLDERGQGTTEYAILVGVLAVTAFRDKVGELWDAITKGINGL